MASMTDTLAPRRSFSAVCLGYARAGLGALVLGGTFGAGMLMGAESQGDEGASADGQGRLRSPVALADARTEKLEAVKEELKLRFHDELVGPPRDAQDRETSSPAKPLVKAAPGDRAKGDAAHARILADRASPEDARESETAVKADDADEDVESIAVPQDNPKRDQRRIAEAIARVFGKGEGASHAADAEPTTPPAAAAEPAKRTAEPADDPAKAFFVQVASTPNVEGASALKDKLVGQGFPVRVASTELSQRGVMHRVRVGPFPDRAAADLSARQLLDTQGLAGFVTVE